MNLEQPRRTLRGFKIAQGTLGRRIWAVGQRILQLRVRRDKVLGRVPVQTVRPELVVKLAPEVKPQTNLVKMVAYQAQRELVRAVAAQYGRARDEGRTLMQAAFLSAGRNRDGQGLVGREGGLGRP